ncbi:unnamed protein product [Discosporangium mesarthrocarpum]
MLWWGGWGGGVWVQGTGVCKSLLSSIELCPEWLGGASQFHHCQLAQHYQQYLLVIGVFKAFASFYHLYSQSTRCYLLFCLLIFCVHGGLVGVGRVWGIFLVRPFLALHPPPTQQLPPPLSPTLSTP